MPDFPPIFVAALTGLISGLVLCIPVGPVNLTIINEGARRGFKWAALIGIGASVMEVIYCTIAFTGFSSIFANRYIKAGMEVFSFMFMVFLGIKFMTAKTVRAPLNMVPWRSSVCRIRGSGSALHACSCGRTCRQASSLQVLSDA